MPPANYGPPCMLEHSSRAKRRIGLLGGSFNPAHAGHLHVSLLALKMLRLHAVWWLVSPQNPLKSRIERAYADRIRLARAAAAADPRIYVSDLEHRLDARYSIETLAILKRRFPRYRFVWIGGADILLDFHRWRRWRRIFRALPIVIFDRPQYLFPALASRAAKTFRRHRRPIFGGAGGGAFVCSRPPAWAIVPGPRLGVSATAIRQNERTKKVTSLTIGPYIFGSCQADKFMPE
jgi:nicotinate-nucleotide adenylyltransferase